MKVVIEAFKILTADTLGKTLFVVSVINVVGAIINIISFFSYML